MDGAGPECNVLSAPRELPFKIHTAWNFAFIVTNANSFFFSLSCTPPRLVPGARSNSSRTPDTRSRPTEVSGSRDGRQQHPETSVELASSATDQPVDSGLEMTCGPVHTATTACAGVRDA